MRKKDMTLVDLIGYTIWHRCPSGFYVRSTLAEKVAKEILVIVKSRLPSANRKSCPAGEHYHQRFKEGWNECLRRTKGMLSAKDLTRRAA